MRSGADQRGRMGRKEILGLTDGYRESTQSSRELLLDLKRRGLTHAGTKQPGNPIQIFTAKLLMRPNTSRAVGHGTMCAGVWHIAGSQQSLIRRQPHVSYVR